MSNATKVVQRHKVRRAILFAVSLFVAIVLAYCASVLITAYIDTPKVVAVATAPDRIKLQVKDVSPEFQQILLTVEDPAFYTHHGVDLSTPGAGWTTITQGLVKIYFYNGFTPGTFRYRKFGQSLIALVFNSRVDKQTQLLMFINSAYFGSPDGEDVVGFSDAAKVYFHKDFSELTRDEFVSLVAMLVGPNLYNVKQQPQKNQERVGRINRLLSGQCKPTGLSDVYYEACR
ncbi:MAG TPA: biosynthetic peptidoglycan transglycosylase [Pyrinomonadaceae bacterium]|nr:biosynthetic peptidoglycan transglycosylase [Pyrinomonadaceae bacterium]